MLKILLIFYLIIHLILCLLIYIGVRTRLLRFSEQLMPIAVFVPIFGIIMCLIADIISRGKRTGTRAFSLEDLALDEDDLRMVHVQNDSSDAIVPLEEALLINDSATRRNLMLNILRENPNEYVHLLQSARLDDDIEVTHYASTAIMEIQREYELTVQKCDKKYREAPDDPEVLSEYIDALSKYIESGLVDENILFIYRRRMSELLAEKIKQGTNDPDIYMAAVETSLALDNAGDAAATADQMILRWPSGEKSWIAKLKVAQQIGDGEGIKKVVAEVKFRNVYLSPEGRNIISFWDQNSTENA